MEELLIGQIQGFRGLAQAAGAPGLASQSTAKFGRFRKFLIERSALTHCLEYGAVAIDNNHLERQITPWAMGSRAWLFACGELAGQRTAMVMSRVQSARLNGHDPWAYLCDLLECLPTQRSSQIEDLLPHRWQAVSDAAP